MNKEFFFYGLFIMSIETLLSKVFYSCRVIPKIFEQHFLKKYLQG